MKVFTTKKIAFIILGVLIVLGYYFLYQNNQKLKDKLVEKEVRIETDSNRIASMINKFRADLQQYQLDLRNLKVNYKVFSESSPRNKYTLQEKYYYATALLSDLSSLRGQLKGFEYMLNFPHYYSNDTLVKQFSQLRKIEIGLRGLVVSELDKHVNVKGHIWVKDTLILSRFQELMEVSERFQELIAQ